jgi:hypothetical protein
MAAALSGARAAAVIAGRVIPFVGTALLAAWLLNEWLQSRREAVPGGPDWATGTWLCGGPGDYFAPQDAGCGASIGCPPAFMNKVNRASLGDGRYTERCNSGNDPYLQSGQYWPHYPPGFVGHWTRIYNPGHVLPTGVVDPPMTATIPGRPAVPARDAAADPGNSDRPWTPPTFPLPAEMGTGRVGGYAPPWVEGSRPGEKPVAGAPPVVAPAPGVFRPSIPAIDGWGGVWPEAIDRPVAIPISPGNVGVFVPGIGTAVSSDGRKVRVVPLVRAAAPARPADVKELKARVSAALAGFRMFYNSATEAGDFVDALHSALPPCRQAKTEKSVRQQRAARKYGWNNKFHKSEASPAAKLSAVTQFLRDYAADPFAAKDACQGYGRTAVAQRWAGEAVWQPDDGFLQNARKSDALQQFTDKALKNLVVENFKDFMWGTTGRKLGELTREVHNLPFGFQTLRSVSQFKL